MNRRGFLQRAGAAIGAMVVTREAIAEVVDDEATLHFTQDAPLELGAEFRADDNSGWFRPNDDSISFAVRGQTVGTVNIPIEQTSRALSDALTETNVELAKILEAIKRSK